MWFETAAVHSNLGIMADGPSFDHARAWAKMAENSGLLSAVKAAASFVLEAPVSVVHTLAVRPSLFLDGRYSNRCLRVNLGVVYCVFVRVCVYVCMCVSVRVSVYPRGSARRGLRLEKHSQR